MFSLPLLRCRDEEMRQKEEDKREIKAAQSEKSAAKRKNKAQAEGIEKESHARIK